MGIIHIPVTNTTYWTSGDNNAWRQLGNNKPEIIRCTKADPSALRVIMSKSHTNEQTESYLESLPVGERVHAGSSLKFCRIAEGEADLYPRFGSIMEWDIAAGHAILSAAGGSVTEFDGRPILYGDKTFRTPYFLAKGILP
jgi:3'(2'), 5'-bisphosphate nucleotidase